MILIIEHLILNSTLTENVKGKDFFNALTQCETCFEASAGGAMSEATALNIHCHYSSASFESLMLCFWSSAMLTHAGSSRWRTKYLCFIPLCWKPRWCTWFLASTWPSHGSCGRLRSNSVDGGSPLLVLFLSPIFCTSIFQINRSTKCMSYKMISMF